MRRPIVLTAVALGALALASGAMAQTPLRVGQTVEGSLSGDDPSSRTDEEGGSVRFDDYRLDLRRGQRIEATLTADFDTTLSLWSGETIAADAPGEPAVFNDDDGDSTNSRLRYTAPADGPVTLRASSLIPAEGAYRLAVTDRGPAPRAPRPRDLRLGDEVRGDLGPRDPVDDADRAYDAWRLNLDAGERVALAMTSDAIDTLLIVGRDETGVFDELAMNDDDGEGTNSALVFQAPAAGAYIVRAVSYGGTEGAYRLTAAEGPPAPPSTPLTLGVEAEGRLSPDDAEDPAGVRHDAWRVTLAEGQRIEVVMRSDAFDTYLQVGTEGPGGLETLVEDDDGLGEGTDSRATLTAERAGDYLIHARALGEGEGDYTLVVREIAPDPAPTPLSPASGAIQGEIDDDDPSDAGRHFDAWAVSGVEGRRARFVMRSGDFDTYLEIGAAGETFEAEASDDDGLGEGTDSRLDFVFPTTGDYILRTSPLGAGSDGLYSIEMTDRGPAPATGSLMVGATTRGSLTEDSSISEFGAFYDDYAVTLAADQKLRITLVSNAFDAVLMIAKAEDVDGASVTSMATDDDGLSDTHSKLDITIEDAGDYIIRAAALAPKQSGDYVLTVEARE